MYSLHLFLRLCAFSNKWYRFLHHPMTNHHPYLKNMMNWNLHLHTIDSYSECSIPFYAVLFISLSVSLSSFQWVWVYVCVLVSSCRCRTIQSHFAFDWQSITLMYIYVEYCDIWKHEQTFYNHTTNQVNKKKHIETLFWKCQYADILFRTSNACSIPDSMTMMHSNGESDTRKTMYRLSHYHEQLTKSLCYTSTQQKNCIAHQPLDLKTIYSRFFFTLFHNSYIQRSELEEIIEISWKLNWNCGCCELKKDSLAVICHKLNVFHSFLPKFIHLKIVNTNINVPNIIEPSRHEIYSRWLEFCILHTLSQIMPQKNVSFWSIQKKLPPWLINFWRTVLYSCHMYESWLNLNWSKILFMKCETHKTTTTKKRIYSEKGRLRSTNENRVTHNSFLLSRKQ